VCKVVFTVPLRCRCQKTDYFSLAMIGAMVVVLSFLLNVHFGVLMLGLFVVAAATECARVAFVKRPLKVGNRPRGSAARGVLRAARVRVFLHMRRDGSWVEYHRVEGRGWTVVVKHLAPHSKARYSSVEVRVEGTSVKKPTPSPEVTLLERVVVGLIVAVSMFGASFLALFILGFR
jgi:hypothetical protein